MIRQTIQNTIQNTIRSTLGDDAFSILALFSGRNGVWYDPTDLATMYQEHTGGSPVTANGQPVGLMLDKSRGELVRDVELVTNGTFDTDSDWLTSPQSSISEGVARIVSTDGSYQFIAQSKQAYSDSEGKVLKITLDVVDYVAGTLKLQFSGHNSSIVIPSAIGSYTFYFLNLGTTGSFYIARVAGITDVTVDNISVKELIGIPATQSTASQRPTYNTDPSRLTLDGVDDSLEFTVPTGGWDGKMVVGTDKGTASYGVSLPAGAYELGGDYFFGDTINGVAIFEGDVSDSDLKKVEAEFVKNGAKASYGDVVNFDSYWRDKNITEFPLIDTSSGVSFRYAWFNNNNLTSFPLIDTSRGANFYAAWYGNNLTSFPLIDISSGTNFSYAWYGNNALADFLVNMFDNCLCTNFTGAFLNTALTQASIDNILVSIASNGTSNGTFGQSGGNAPSEAGEAAIDALVTRGWTVTVTGGYQGKILPAGLFDNDENGFWYSMDIGA